MCSVHGDDFTTAAAKPDLDWFESELEAKYGLLKSGRIDPGKSDDKEGRVLNCAVRWTHESLEYEAGRRQADKLIESIGLSGDNVRSIVTPGIKCIKEQVDEEKDLETHEHTPFRGNGARCN